MRAFHQLSLNAQALNMENIFTAVKPFYFATKCLGLFPLSFDGTDTQGRFKSSWTDVAASLLALSASLAAVILIFTDLSVSNSALLHKLWIMQTILCTSSLSIPFFYQISKRQSIVNFLHAVNKIDAKVNYFFIMKKFKILFVLKRFIFQLKTLFLYPNFKHHKRFILQLFIGFMGILFIVAMLGYRFSVVQRLSLFPSCALQFVGIYFFACQFCCAALLIRGRFKLLNGYLQRFDYFVNFQFPLIFFQFLSRTKS